MITAHFLRRFPAARLVSNVALWAVLVAFGAGAHASGPNPPQAQQQAGQPITVEVDGGSNLFVDPLWSSGTKGPCRYLANPANQQWVVPISSPIEWTSMETSGDLQYSENYATQQICCRPSAPTVTLCSAATSGTQEAQIVGGGASGYAVVGAAGAATATCVNPPYGDYVETATFTCDQTGVGTAADGQWSAEQTDTPTCQPNAYVTYGGCSQACSTGGSVGYELKTVYNSCGQITQQAYDGPTCNNQSCCTPDYQVISQMACSGPTTTATYGDVNHCSGSSNYSTSVACSYGVIGGASCSAYCCDGDCETCGGVRDCPTTWSGSLVGSDCECQSSISDGCTSYICYGWQ